MALIELRTDARPACTPERSRGGAWLARLFRTLAGANAAQPNRLPDLDPETARDIGAWPGLRDRATAAWPAARRLQRIADAAQLRPFD